MSCTLYSLKSQLNSQALWSLTALLYKSIKVSSSSSGTLNHPSLKNRLDNVYSLRALHMALFASFSYAATLQHVLGIKTNLNAPHPVICGIFSSLSLTLISTGWLSFSGSTSAAYITWKCTQLKAWLLSAINLLPISG